MLNRYFLGLVAIVALGIGGLQYFGPTRYTIHAGEITGDVASGLSGTFRIEEHRPIEVKSAYPFVNIWLGIDSKRIGGACMLAHPEDLGPAYGQSINSNCSANSECWRDVRNTAGQYVRDYGYCHIPSKTCWARPGPGMPKELASAPYCNRSNDYQPMPQWEPGKDHSANRSPMTAPMPESGKSIRYRVVACLNGIDPATGEDSGACGDIRGTLRRQEMGPVRTITRN